MVFDLLCSWPTNCDYPQFRQMVRNQREQFNEVVIAFTAANTGYDYRQFVRDSMFADHVMCIDVVTPPNDDWRNAAMNQALLHSYNAPHMWFTEQDFVPKPGFFEFVAYHQNAPAIGVYQGDRLHPCSLFLSRETLAKTKRDFSANPPHYDHFGRIQLDLEQAGIDVLRIPPSLYYHYNGLSHNWRLACDGVPITYQPAEFKQWCADALNADVPLHTEFTNMVAKVLDRV